MPAYAKIKKRAILLSGIAAIAIWVGAFAFQEFSNASTQPAAAAIETPAMPVVGEDN
jgi:hypothetical protein